MYSRDVILSPHTLPQQGGGGGGGRTVRVTVTTHCCRARSILTASYGRQSWAVIFMCSVYAGVGLRGRYIHVECIRRRRAEGREACHLRALTTASHINRTTSEGEAWRPHVNGDMFIVTC